MAPRLFTLASVLSLVLCAATAVLWVRSYWICDGWVWGTRASRTYVSGLRGELRWERDTFPPAYSVALPFKVGYLGSPSATATPLRTSPMWFHFGLRGRGQTFPLGFVAGTLRIQTLYIPDSHVLTIALLLPLARAALAFRNRRRVKAGLCSRCGYDLRATPNRCPECGTPTGAASPLTTPSYAG